MNTNMLLLVFWSTLTLSTAASTECYDSIVDIDNLEALVTDFSVPRTYTLCEDTTIPIDSIHSYYGPTPNEAYTMLHLRPNIHIKCGKNGSPKNNCQFVGGDVQVEGTERFGVVHMDRLDGVTLEGLTFVQPMHHMVLLDQPGDVLFLNCAFSVRHNIEASKLTSDFQGATNAQLPVKLDFFDPSSNDLLHVRFRGCSFQNIQFKEFPSQPAIIVGNSAQNRITVTDSSFQDNVMTTNNVKVCVKLVLHFHSEFK